MGAKLQAADYFLEKVAETRRSADQTLAVLHARAPRRLKPSIVAHERTLHDERAVADSAICSLRHSVEHLEEMEQIHRQKIEALQYWIDHYEAQGPAKSVQTH